MKTITKFLFFIALTFGLTYSATAQGYKNGIGLRGGFPSGVTFKHFIKDNTALEFIAGRSWGYRGFLFTALYEKHVSAFDVEGLYFFYGGGAHIGSYDGYYYYNNRKNNYYNDRLMVFGVDAILGLEYKIPPIPFTIGVDVKPSFDIIPFGYGDFDGAFSIRYVF